MRKNNYRQKGKTSEQKHAEWSSPVWLQEQTKYCIVTNSYSYSNIRIVTAISRNINKVENRVKDIEKAFDKFRIDGL